ncbi:MAG: hypothetical protein HRU17_01025 [Polyangiaceae bacterium]|nr:hypothetical protein [Polyangiaceae bacterium]
MGRCIAVVAAITTALACNTTTFSLTDNEVGTDASDDSTTGSTGGANGTDDRNNPPRGGTNSGNGTGGVLGGSAGTDTGQKAAAATRLPSPMVVRPPSPKPKNPAAT